MLASKSTVWGALLAGACVANAALAAGPPMNPFRTKTIEAITVAAAEEIPTPAAASPSITSPADASPADASPEATAPGTNVDRKPIAALGVNIGLPAGKLPQNYAAELMTSVPLAGNMPRPWSTQVYRWQAAATRHQPLYFEEINAERYGYSCNWVAQPFVSTAHFFATLPALPYLKATNCPWECQYTLGHYRPGSCPPNRRHCWPCSPVGASAEAGTLAWLILVLP